MLETPMGICNGGYPIAIERSQISETRSGNRIRLSCNRSILEQFLRARKIPGTHERLPNKEFFGNFKARGVQSTDHLSKFSSKFLGVPKVFFDERCTGGEGDRFPSQTRTAIGLADPACYRERLIKGAAISRLQRVHCQPHRCLHLDDR